MLARSNTIRNKLILLSLTPIVFFLLLNSFHTGPHLRQRIYEAKETQIRDMVTTAHGVLERFYGLEQAGVQPRHQLQEEALAIIRSMRYGPNHLNYLWVTDHQPTLLVHPFREDMADTDLSLFTDPDGVHLFREFSHIAATRGEGALSYQWQFYGDDSRMEPKVSYVMGFEPWGWIVGTGLYTFDIEQAVTAQQRATSLGGAIVALLVGLAFFFVGKSIVDSIQTLQEHAHEISDGRLYTAVSQQELDRSDELGSLARSLDEMRKSLSCIIEELRENQENLAITLLSIGDGVLTTDKEGKITLLNPVAEELTGWKTEDAAGRIVEDVFVITDARTGCPAQNPLRTALATGRPAEMVRGTALISRSGASFYIADSAAPILDTDQQVQGAILVFRNVTKEQEAQEALRQSEERNRSIIELIPDTVFRTSGDGSYLDVIASANRGLAGTQVELVGKTVFEVFPPPTAQCMVDAMRRAICSKALQEIEFEYALRSGEIRWFEARFVPAGSNETLSLMRDITDRRRAQESLKHMTLHDPLTGLGNRRFLEEQAQIVNSESNLPISIVMADVNGLKIINDSLGHQQGDELLRQVANILRSVCRKGDVVARWGGDEFVLLLPKTDADETDALCRQITTSTHRQSDAMQVSIAWGYATKTQMRQAMSDVMKQAEDFMYQRKMNMASSSKGALVMSLQRTLAEKSYETEQHCQNLQKLALALGQEQGLFDSQLNELSLLALLHDIGKVAIPESILNKAGSLSEDEWVIMKKHPEIGFRIAATAPDLSSVARSILCHHERWDGAGYPRGLTSYDIPLAARIIALVDSYEAMTSDRPYRKGMPPDQALEEIEVCAGFQFDPDLVRSFIELMHRQESEALTHS